LLADPVPQRKSSGDLLVVHSSFSTKWHGPNNSEHVLVDGMLNGWLIHRGSSEVSTYYQPAIAFRAAGWASLLAWCLILLFPALLRARYAGMRPGRSPFRRMPKEGRKDELL
jgi:hypothetical protein